MITLSLSLPLFRRTLSVTVAACLLATSSPGLEAAPTLFSNIHTVSSDTAALLKTEALNPRETFIHPVVGRSAAAWAYIKSSAILSKARSLSASSFGNFSWGSLGAQEATRVEQPHSFSLISAISGLVSVGAAALQFSRDSLPQFVTATMAYFLVLQMVNTAIHLFLGVGTLPTATAGCGNLLMVLRTEFLKGNLGLDTVIDIEIPLTIGEDVLRPGFVLPEPRHEQMTVREVLSYMLIMLDVRGRLQAGIVLYLMGGTLTTKINTPKRGDLYATLIKTFELNSRPYDFEEGIMRISAHVRAPTQLAASGKLEKDAAQPHQYFEIDRVEPVGAFVTVNGRTELVETKQTIVVKQGHNGDGDKMDLQGQTLESSAHMYEVLDRLFGIPGKVKKAWGKKAKATKRVGDSKAVVGLADFFFVQGRVKDAIRLAYHLRVVQDRSASDEVRFPPQELFENMGRVLLSGIQQQTRRGRLGAAGLPLSKVSDEQLLELKVRMLQALTSASERQNIVSANKELPEAQRLSSELIQQLQSDLAGPSIEFDSALEPVVRAMQARPVWQRLGLIDKAVDAYFRNTLYNSFTEAATYIEGTFGIVLETTEDSPDNQEVVVFARGQNMSVAWDSLLTYVFGASSRQALNLFRYRYDLNNLGQVFGVSFRMDPVTHRRKFEMRSHLEGGPELTQEQIQSGVIDRHGNRWMKNGPKVFGVDDRIAYEMSLIPKIHRDYLDSLSNPNSANSFTLETIMDVLNQVATGVREGKIVLTGSGPSMESGKALSDLIDAITSGDDLRARYIPPNDIVRAVSSTWNVPKRIKKLGIKTKMFGVGITASGGDTFDTARAIEILSSFIDEVIVYSGLFDIELASALGQGLRKQDLPAGRIMDTGGGWTLAEGATSTDAAMGFATTQSWLRALRSVKTRYPDSDKLALELEPEDFDRLLGPITQEYLDHEARFLGIKMVGGKPEMVNGEPVRIETPEHAERVAQANHLAKHTLESLNIDNFIIPMIYGTVVDFTLHLFPSTWEWLNNLLTFLGNGFAAAWSHIPYLSTTIQSLWSMVPTAWQPVIVDIGSGLHFLGTHLTFITANAAVIMILPMMVARLYRTLQGRDGKRRRGAVQALLIDPARVKTMTLYAKLQARMFNHHQPIFLDASDGNAIHDYGFRVERGTLVIHSRAPEGRLDKADRAATMMVENQVKLVKHRGSGAEMISFDHLPYKTPIQAPYDRYVLETATTLDFTPAQTLELNRFLENLPDIITEFKRQYKDRLLEELPRALGVRLGLHGDQLDTFDKGFEHYIDRQLAFERVFRIVFANAENWTSHYVVAHQWAYTNAHPRLLRAIVFLSKFVPDRVMLKFPVLNVYIDISRTFVGTRAIVTASPFEAGRLAAVRKKYTSNLNRRSPPSEQRPDNPDVGGKPPVVTGRRLPTSLLRQEDFAVASRKDTSLTGKALDAAPTGIKWIPVYLEQDGTLGRYPSELTTSDFPRETYEFLQSLLKETKEQLPSDLYMIQVRDISNRPAFLQTDTGRDEVDGIIYLDARLVNEAISNPAARDALSLELAEEKDHIAWSGKAGTSKRAVELHVLRTKLKRAMLLPQKRREDLVTYLRRHEVYDPAHLNLAALYALVGNDIDRAAPRPDDLNDDQLNFLMDQVLKFRSVEIESYVDRAFADANLSQDPEFILPSIAPAFVSPAFTSSVSGGATPLLMADTPQAPTQTVKPDFAFSRFRTLLLTDSIVLILVLGVFSLFPVTASWAPSRPMPATTESAHVNASLVQKDIQSMPLPTNVQIPLTKNPPVQISRLNIPKMDRPVIVPQPVQGEAVERNFRVSQADRALVGRDDQSGVMSKEVALEDQLAIQAEVAKLDKAMAAAQQAINQNGGKITANKALQEAVATLEFEISSGAADESAKVVGGTLKNVIDSKVLSGKITAAKALLPPTPAKKASIFERLKDQVMALAGLLILPFGFGSTRRQSSIRQLLSAA